MRVNSLGAAAAHIGTPTERVRAFIDRALADDKPLLRSFWLAAASDVVLDEPVAAQKPLYIAAARRIHATFRLHPHERQAAVRVLAERILPVG